MKFQRRNRLSFGKQARIRSRVRRGTQVLRFGLMATSSDSFTIVVESYTPPDQQGSGSGGSRRGNGD